MATTKKKATAKKKAVAKKEETAVKKKSTGGDQAAEFLAEMRKSGELGVTKKIEVIPTGSLILNRCIGDGNLKGNPGGFPRGCVTEIFGDESTGKTTYAILAAAHTLNQGGRVFWADFEHNLRAQLTYCENLGLDVKHPNFFWIQPKNFEDGVKRVGQSLFKLKPAPAMIVIDSVTAMAPKVAVEGEAGEDIQIGKHAKLTGQFLNWITKYLHQTNTALILLNQTRVNIKTSKYDPGPAQVSSGGNAPKFFATVRVQLKKTSQGEKVSTTSDLTGAKDDKIVNVCVKASVIKNKFDIPYKSGPIYLAYGRGVDNIMSLVILGLNKKIFKKGSGSSWIEWKDPNGGKLSFKVQGKAGLVRYLEDHPETLEALKPLLVPSKDVNVMFDRMNELEAIPEESMSDEDRTELETLKDQLSDEAPEEEEDISTSDDSDALAELDAMIPEDD